YGLGRVAAVPMDFQSGAAAWPTWRGFAKLWSQLVMWAAPPGLASEASIDARPVDGGTLVTVESRAPAPPSALRFAAGREAALRARPGVQRRLVPLDVVLIPLALVLVLADVALRRLRRIP